MRLQCTLWCDTHLYHSGAALSQDTWTQSPLQSGPHPGLVVAALDALKSGKSEGLALEVYSQGVGVVFDEYIQPVRYGMLEQCQETGQIRSFLQYWKKVIWDYGKGSTCLMSWGSSLESCSRDYRQLQRMNPSVVSGEVRDVRIYFVPDSWLRRP